MIHKLNTKLSINDLRAYYHTVAKDYQRMCWIQNNEVESTNKKWGNNQMVNSLYGWAIDSNLEDINSPCPPYNISTRNKLPTYRNTVLAFCIINELQKIFPYGYRWAISVQEPGGYVNRHQDNPKNLTVWIPIYNPPKSGLIMYYDDKEVDHHLKDDGSLYLVDTKIDHKTYNNDTTDRVLLSFRFLTEHLDKVLLQ